MHHTIFINNKFRFVRFNFRHTNRYEDGKEISEFRTIDTSQTDNGLIEMMSISLRVKSSTSDEDTKKEFTCKGKIYDQFCPDVQEFQSAPWAVDVMPAQPIDGPGKYGYVNLLDT